MSDYSEFTPASGNDYSSFTPVAQQSQGSNGYEGFQKAQAPQSKLSNLPTAMKGMFWSTIDNGTLMQPARFVAEHLGLGMDELKAKYPGQSDDWYKQRLHQAYGQAVTNLRQQDQAAVDTNPYPGHLIGNTAVGALASIPANPELAFVPGASLEAGAFKNGIRAALPQVAKVAGVNAARFGAANAASDAAAQVMDMAEGQQKDYDVTRSLKAAGMGAVLGAGGSVIHAGVAHPAVQGVIQDAPVPDFVKNLFLTRGTDTTPQADPTLKTSPLTGERVQLSPEEQRQFKQLLKTGSVDDIKGFLQGKNGPQPTWAQVNQMVEMRDKLPAQDSMVNGDNVHQALSQAIDESHRQLVSDHIDAVSSDWKNKPNVEVVNNVNDIQDPEVRQQAINEGVTHENTVGFVGKDGTVRVFAPQVRTPEAVNSLLYHEALGHFGLAQQFGDGLDKILGSLADRNVGQFGKDVDAWQKANPSAYGGSRVRAAEEVLAEMSQKGPLPKSMADAMMAHVRNFGRKMGLKLSYSDSEVRHVLAMAHDAVIRGKEYNVVGNNFGGEHPPVTSNHGQWLNLDNSEPTQQHSMSAGNDWREAWSSEDDQGNRYMTPAQLNKSIADGLYQVNQMEEAYNATDRDYEPTTRSWADVRQDALREGFSPSKIKNQGQLPDLAKRVFQTQAAAKVLDSRISGILERWDTPDLTQGDRDNLRQALVDHAYILTKLRNERADMARALNISKLGYTRSQMESFGEILRESGGPESPLGDDDTLNRFARQLKTLRQSGNTEGMNAMVSNITKPHWEDYLTTIHQNMMLSGISTHVKAPLDMMIGIGRDLLDNASALPLSAAREALRAVGVNVKPGVHPTEVAARLYGILRAGFDAETYKNTAKAFVNGGVNPTGFGGRPNARVPLVSKVGDLITAQDQFFRAFATNMHLYGLGTRQALEEARLNGTPKDWDTIMTQGSNYARSPSKELLAEAKGLADQNLLLNKNSMTEPLDRLRRKGMAPDASAFDRATAFVTNFIAPFIRVEANSLMNRVIRRSPLALFDKQTLADLKAGGIQGDVALTRVVMGSAAIASYWMAAGKGKITGEGPDNPSKKAVLEATGWRPNAVHENGQYNTGNKLGTSLNPFDVHNATASTIADLREAYEKGANQGQVGTGLKLAILSTIKHLGDMSYISDLAPMISAITAPNQTMEGKVGQFLGDQASTMVPNLVGQAERVHDQGQPMTQVPGSIGQTVLNSMKANIPGQREQLPKRMDVYGEPYAGGASTFGQHTWLPQGNRLTGGNRVDETTDPAKLEIARLSPKYVENLVSPVQRTIKINGDSMKLDNKQFSEYQRMAGQEILATLRDQMNSPEWQQMSDDDKATWIRDMQTEKKRAVREYLYGN